MVGDFVDGNSFSVLIVTYNSENSIIDLLGDIKHLDEDVLERTLIVDNNSSDETVNTIRSKFPRVRITQNDENVGYGRAVNQGVCENEFELFLLLNPDIRLPSGFFTKMVNIGRSDNFGAAGPLQFKLKGNRKILNFCWSFWKFECFKLFLAHKLRLKRSCESPISVTYLNAGCLLINRSAFLQVGGFDERNFLYGEEPDLFLKFKLFGYKSFLHPGVEVIHYRDQSINKLTWREYIRVKCQALINIVSALARGYSKIIANGIKNKSVWRDYA